MIEDKEVKEHSTPKLSVVVIPFQEKVRATLSECLHALRNDSLACGGVEILGFRGRSPDRIDESHFPAVRWIDAPAPLTIPELRQLALVGSSAPLVAFVEEDCIVQPGWCAAAVKAHAGIAAAVGGPVEPDDFSTGLDWAVFLCDYGRFMAPFTGNVDRLSGNNMSYKREALDQLESLLESQSGIYEAFVNDELIRRGFTLQAESGMAVRNLGAGSLRNVTSVPYQHGRAFGGMRRGVGSLGLRLWLAARTVALPLVQTIRLYRMIAAKGRFRGRLFGALPWILLLYSSWALGEAAGYLCGPGNSKLHWR